jgi:bifunctional DNase/RNase
MVIFRSTFGPLESIRFPMRAASKLPFLTGFTNLKKLQLFYTAPSLCQLKIDLLNKFSITLHSLQIDSIEEGVYYAQLTLSEGSHEEHIDCRPSDGIALALRAGVPIFVDENVLASAGQKTEDLPPMIDLAVFLKK